MKNIKHYLDILDKHRDEMAMAFMSDPGLSKTSQCKEWCEEHGRRYFEFITSQRMPSEISGMAMPDNDEKRMKIYDFDYLLDMKDGDMLAFDEFTNGNIMTLNACLTLIQERSMLSGRKLPSILVVAMGNHQGQCDLLPQTKQRFVWVDVMFDRETWANWIYENLQVRVSNEVLTYIENQYSHAFKPNEYNYLTARSVTNMIKLAKDIKESDPIWNRMPDVQTRFVHELYKCFDDEDFTKFQFRVRGYALRISAETEGDKKDKNILLASLRKAENEYQLKQTIKACEKTMYGAFGLRFVDALKNAKEE